MNTPDGSSALLDAIPHPDAPTIERLHARLVLEATRDGVLDLEYRTLDSPIGQLLLVATEQGVVRIAFEREDHHVVLEHLAASISPRILRGTSRLDAAAAQLDEYFARRRRHFDLPLDLQLARGFRRTVLDHLRELRYGSTASYSTIASAAGSPAAVRAVGTACATNPLPIVIPCHRVLRRDGKIGEYLGGTDAKRALLAMESVIERSAMDRKKRVVIIGAGPGGICAGIRLKHAGYDDFVVLDKAPSIGGTWFHNQYPGCACDIQSHLYSFSFEINRDWSRPYATQPEILEYMRHCVDKYDLAPHIRLSTTATAAYWDDECTMWRVITDSGDEIEADVLISALGMFNDLNYPDIAGLDSFEGKLFHSARWDHDHDLNGERIAVIGTAASAVQFLPTVATRAGQLHVFQRSANWVLPKVDETFTPEQLEHFRHDPVAARQVRWDVWRRVEGVITFSDPAMLKAAEEAGLKNLETVRDLEVRRKLTPHVPWGCHRPLSSNDYYPIYNQPNVELVTEPIARVTNSGIVTVDGVERAVDTIILGTGFKTTRYLSAVDVVGTGGQRVNDAWSDGAQAYLGITTSGFPNLFMLYGPNTNNGSILFMIECQVSYILRQLERMTSEGLAWLDVRRDVMDAYNEELQRDIDKVDVWQAACHGYYRSPSGRIVTQWPHTMAEFRDRTMRPDSDAYDAHHGVPLGAALTGQFQFQWVAAQSAKYNWGQSRDCDACPTRHRDTHDLPSRIENRMAKSSKPLTKCKICGGSIQRRWSLGNPEREPWQHLDEDDWIDNPHDPEAATA